MVRLTGITQLLSALLLLGAVNGSGYAADAWVPVYKATYRVSYKGRNVGTSEFIVSYDESTGRYTFSSSTRVKGLLRLISPKPAIEHSEFVVVDDEIRPLEFWYEDGSRKGEDNYHTVFDWQNGTATVEIEGGSRELALEPGALDRGSMQVAVMRDMARGAPLGPYVLADESSLKTYEYSAGERGSTETRHGTYETQRFTQEREGSSRRTALSVAPALSHLPVRIEQIRNGVAETVFVLDSLEGIEPR